MSLPRLAWGLLLSLGMQAHAQEEADGESAADAPVEEAPAEEAQGVRVTPGDILLVGTGRDRRRSELGIHCCRQRWPLTFNLQARKL